MDDEDAKWRVIDYLAATALLGLSRDMLKPDFKKMDWGEFAWYVQCPMCQYGFKGRHELSLHIRDHDWNEVQAAWLTRVL